MRVAAVLMSAAALVVSASSVSAQAKPNFGAQWAVVVNPAAAAPAPGRGGGRGLGQAATIAQDDKTLTITRTTQVGEIKMVYNLDGSESKNTMSFGGNSVEQVAKTKWDGNKLVITTTSNFNGTAMETTMVLSLEADGSLVVETTGAGRGGGAPTTTRMTYKKA